MRILCNARDCRMELSAFPAALAALFICAAAYTARAADGTWKGTQDNV